MNPLINEFLDYLTYEKKKSTNTLSAYKADLLRLFAFLESKGIFSPEKVRITDLNAYVLDLEKKSMSSATVARNISCLKNFFEWMFYKRYIDGNPAKDLKAPKVMPKKRDVLTKEQLENLLNAPDRSTPKGKRDFAILNLLCNAGLKSTELISIKNDDINLLLGTVKIYDEGLFRLVRIDEKTRAAISDYEECRSLIYKENNDNIFFVNMNGQHFTRQGLWKVVKDYANSVGLGEIITPNILRLTYAADKIEQGTDIQELQTSLGISASAVAQLYISYGKRNGRARR